MNEQQDKAILLRSTLELEKGFSKRTSGPKRGGKLTQRERAHGTEACFGFNKVLLKSCFELSDYRLIVWRKKRFTNSKGIIQFGRVLQTCRDRGLRRFSIFIEFSTTKYYHN